MQKPWQATVVEYEGSGAGRGTEGDEVERVVVCGGKSASFWHMHRQSRAWAEQAGAGQGDKRRRS